MKATKEAHAMLSEIIIKQTAPSFSERYRFLEQKVLQALTLLGVKPEQEKPETITPTEATPVIDKPY